jgi:hypothetical protein
VECLCAALLPGAAHGAQSRREAGSRTVVELQQHGGVEAGGAQHLHGPRVEVALDRDAAQAVDPRQPPVLGPVIVERLQARTSQQLSGVQTLLRRVPASVVRIS